MGTCQHNPAHPLAADADPRRRFCSNACKEAAYRVRLGVSRAQFRADAAALVRRQTAAVIAGDAAALAQVQAEALALFGPS